MAFLILPSRRTRQPQGAVRIRPYWLGRGLQFLFNGATYSDIVRNQLLEQPVGVIPRRASNGAYPWQGPDISGSNYLRVADATIGNITGPLTIVWRGVFDEVVGSYRYILSKAETNGANATPFDIFTDYATGEIYCLRAGSYVYRQQNLSTLAQANVNTTIGLMWDSGQLEANFSAFVNRVAQTYTTPVTGTGVVTGNGNSMQIGRRKDGATQLDGSIDCVALFSSALTSAEYLALYDNLWGELTLSDPRRLYFAPSGGGTTTNERTVAARTKARGAATTTAIHDATTAGRIRARAADAVVPIHLESVAGRVKARGADARTSIHAATAAGRVKARAANTVEHIDAGAVSRTIAGKVRARGAAATLAIRATSIVGRVQARGADTVTSTRLSLAAGRVKTRAAIAAAPVVAGMVVTTAAGRIQARSAIATTATRIEAIAGRVTARGTDTANSIRAATAAGRLRGRGAAAAGPYVAPTLPLEVPESTRVLVDKTERLGASPSPTIWDPVLNRRVPAPRKPPRLG